MKFRTRIVEKEAFKLGFDPMPDWFCDRRSKGDVTTHDDGYEYDRNRVKAMIKTLEGTMTADHGDYIILGLKGEIYPCKPDIFEKSYEPVTI